MYQILSLIVKFFVASFLLLFHLLLSLFYSTIPHSYASYDNVSTSVSSSTSYLEYSENISHSMELNSYTNATEINYADVQFSNSLYESNHPQNNTQIYADNYYYDPNIGISGDSGFDNLTADYNSSGLSGDRSSLEVSLKLIHLAMLFLLQYDIHSLF